VVAQEGSEVNTIFRREAPSVQFFEKVYHAYVKPFEGSAMISRVVYEIMWECNMWYASGDAYASLNYTNQKKKLKSSHIFSMAREKAKELRHPFTVQTAHGVTFTISMANRQKRRKPKEFNKEEMIRGWGEQKHVSFCTANSFSPPLPLTDTKPLTEAKIPAAQATMTSSHSVPIVQSPVSCSFAWQSCSCGNPDTVMLDNNLPIIYTG
jgi:hypothetical protein